MNLSQIASLIRAHGIKCRIEADSVIAEDTYTKDGISYTLVLAFPAGTKRSSVLAWLNY
jgi:hypothetical protein